ncbi:MAG: c-type cytochrome [Candidatus Thiodiazotropha sp.]
MIKTTSIAGISLLALSLSGCSDVNDYKPGTGLDGKAMFDQACASCHGESGTGKFGFLLKISGSDESAEEIAEKISKGGSVMPAFPNISHEEALGIALYLKGE